MCLTLRQPPSSSTPVLIAFSSHPGSGPNLFPAGGAKTVKTVKTVNKPVNLKVKAVKRVNRPVS